VGIRQAKNLLHSKGNHQPNEKTTYKTGENIANDVSDKGLIYKVYKELLSSIQKKKLIT